MHYESRIMEKIPIYDDPYSYFMIQLLSRPRGSNPGPSVYKTDALTN